MDENKIQEVEQRLENITQKSWLSAVFTWGSIKREISELKTDFSQMAREVTSYSKDVGELNDKVSKLENANELTNKDLENKKDAYTKLELEKGKVDEKLNTATKEKSEYEKENSSLKKDLENKKEEVEKKINETEQVKNRYEKKIEEQEEKEKQEIEQKHKDMELTWSKHEEKVSTKLKEISERLGVTQIESNEYEYQGKPDNVVMIANEYIIFDAKSPKKYDELGNFSNYLKDQAEKAKKYAKNEKVKKDVYLVVPENTLETLTTTYYEEGTYRVHIISINSLETILRSLQKIDEYENLKEIAPEEREALFNFVGRLLHATKRRIQVDALYSTHVDAIIKEAVSAISNDTRDQIEHYEKASKWNPGRDEKKKRITEESSEKSAKDLQKVAFGQELNTNQEEFSKIEEIPLNKK